MRYDDAHDLHRHQDDQWLDEIRLVGADGPLLRLVLRYRYKTSDMSGDEWRTSTMWQCSDLCRMDGDQHGPEGWHDFDGAYGGKLETGCAALYPGLYTSQSHAHATEVVGVEFLRKGRKLYGSDHAGESRPLLTVAGHLPWALVCAKDEPLGTNEAWADYARLCHQPGCAEDAVSTYAFRTHALGDRGLVHRFCPLHLRRGDCGREDNDANYVVIDGLGPDDAVGWREYESRAVLM